MAPFYLKQPAQHNDFNDELKSEMTGLDAVRRVNISDVSLVRPVFELMRLMRVPAKPKKSELRWLSKL
jgi:hypothetical protein